MSLHFQCIALLPSALPQFPQQGRQRLTIWPVFRTVLTSSPQCKLHQLFQPPVMPPTFYQKPVAALSPPDVTDTPIAQRRAERFSQAQKWRFLLFLHEKLFFRYGGGSVNWFNTRLVDRFNASSIGAGSLCTSRCNSSASHRSGCAKRKRIRVINFN